MKSPDQQLPDWYWTRGLHDAIVLSVSEKDTCLEICLDSKNSMLERDIQKILLFKYQIQTPEIPPEDLTNIWWLRDTVETLPDHRYLLEIIFETCKGKRKRFAVVFQKAQIERNI